MPPVLDDSASNRTYHEHSVNAHSHQGQFLQTPVGDPRDGSAAEGFMTAAVPLGAVAGAIIAAVWSDRFGRRRVLLACSVLFGIGSTICGIAPDIGMLTIARLMLGLATGASAFAAPMFLAELARQSGEERSCRRFS